MRIFPAIQGSVGTWRYYSTKMTAAELSSQVKFASEVWDSKALDHWIQRALNHSRAKRDISGYLAKHEDRFFNSIVVAAIEGDPVFFPVTISDDPRFQLIDTGKMNDAFGILRFDGSEKYYALDGQHRLRAIRALLDNETEFSPPPAFEDEEFSVIIVVQKAGESRHEFMRKYRRLFSHLNRHAKPMDKATTIIMEEDDAFAIITRRLIQEHPFFSWIDGEATRVRCEGSESMSSRDPYFTNIITLYGMTIALLSSPERINRPDWGEQGRYFKAVRPSDECLDDLYEEVSVIWDAILAELSVLSVDPRLMRTNLAEDTNSDGEIASNHLLFRPIGQDLLARLVRTLIDTELAKGAEFSSDLVKFAVSGLGSLEWRLFKAPWRNLFLVYQEDRWKMRNEDRKLVQRIGFRLLRWITGVDTYSTEEDLEDALRRPWEDLLVHTSDEEAEELWGHIMSAAIEFAGRSDGR